MWSKRFWKDTFERVLFTFAQALVGAGVVVGLTLDEWRAAFAIAFVAAFLSLVKAVAATGFGDPDSASLGADPVEDSFWDDFEGDPLPDDAVDESGKAGH